MWHNLREYLYIWYSKENVDAVLAQETKEAKIFALQIIYLEKCVKELFAAREMKLAKEVQINTNDGVAMTTVCSCKCERIFQIRERLKDLSASMMCSYKDLLKLQGIL